MSKDLTPHSTEELGIFLVKLESHMGNLQAILDRHMETRHVIPMYDADSKVKNAVTNKLNELGAISNQIHLEIEARFKKVFHIEFEYDRFTDIDIESKEAHIRALTISRNQLKKTDTITQVDPAAVFISKKSQPKKTSASVAKEAKRKASPKK